MMHLQQILRQHRTILFALTLCVAVPAAQAQLVAVEEDTGNLYRVFDDRPNPNARIELIGNTEVSNIGALEYNPYNQTLYGFTTGADAALYSFEIAPTLDNVTAHQIGDGLGFFVYEGGLAFAPDGTPDGKAYGLNGGVTTPVLFEVDLTSGEAAVIGPLGGRHDIAGLGWHDDGFLVGLDSTTETLLTINPATAETGHIMDINVGPAVGSVGGMFLDGDTGYFSTAGPNALTEGSNALYSFDLTNLDSPQYEHIGYFNGSPGIYGTGFAALSVIPEPTTLGLLILGSIGLLRRRAT